MTFWSVAPLVTPKIIRHASLLPRMRSQTPEDMQVFLVFSSPSIQISPITFAFHWPCYFVSEHHRLSKSNLGKSFSSCTRFSVNHANHEALFTLAGIFLAAILFVFCVRSRSGKVAIPTGLEFFAEGKIKCELGLKSEFFFLCTDVVVHGGDDDSGVLPSNPDRHPGVQTNQRPSSRYMYLTKRHSQGPD